MRNLLFIAILTTACQPEPTPDVPEAEPKTQPKAQPNSQATSKPEEKSQPTSAAESLSTGTKFLGTPHGKDQIVSLTWATDGSAPARKTCDGEPSEDATKVTMKKGENVVWDDAVTIVQQGVQLESQEAHTIEVSPLGKLNEIQPAIEMQVSKGTMVEVLKRANATTCFVRIENMLGEMPCPSMPRFAMEGWDGKTFRHRDVWCVRMNEGWIRVEPDVIDVRLEAR